MADGGRKAVTVYLSSSAIASLKAFQEKIGASTRGEALEEIITSNDLSRLDFEQQREQLILLAVKETSSFRKAAIRLNSEKIPSIIPWSKWTHSTVSKFIDKVGLNGR